MTKHPCNRIDPRPLTRRTVLQTAGLMLSGATAWPLAAPAQTAVAQLANSALQFGMVPYLPVQQLVRLYEPLTRSFEQTLQRPCRLGSATDFDQFLERARKGDFDIVGGSPHVLRILQKEEGFEPLARASAVLEPLVLVSKGNNTLLSVSDLRGQRVMVADALALHVLIALRALRDAGINPAKEFSLTLAGNQRNAISRMLKGEATAAVASESTLASLPPELAQNVRVLLRAPKGLTPMGFMVHPRLRSQAPALRSTILQMTQTAPGKEMLKATQQEGYVALTLAELASQDNVVTEFYRQRAAPRPQ
jgi:phosphonate transport system substrate-binding protein